MLQIKTCKIYIIIETKIYIMSINNYYNNTKYIQNN